MESFFIQMWYNYRIMCERVYGSYFIIGLIQGQLMIEGV